MALGALVAAGWLLCAGAWGESASPGSAPIGGRPAALGHAYSALAEDAYAPVWNPAGLARLPVAQASLMHAGASGAAARQSATLALPLSAASGAGFAADLADGQAMYGLAYGRRWGPAALGAAARYLDGDGGGGADRPHAWTADLASLYRFDERLTAAFVAANLGGRAPSLQEPGFLRPEARLGAGYVASRRIAYSLEAVYSKAGGAGVRSGLELRLLGWLAARLGVDSTEQTGSALGVTTGVGLGWAGQSLDVAYVPRGRDSLEQLSLVLRFGRLPEPALDEEADAPPAPPAKRVGPASSVTVHLEPAAATPEPPATRPAPVPQEQLHLQPSKSPSLIWLP